MLDDTLLEIPKFLKDNAMKSDTTKSEPKSKIGDTYITKDGWEMKYSSGGYWIPIKDTNAVKTNNIEEVRQFILEKVSYNNRTAPNCLKKKKPMLKWLREQMSFRRPDLNPSSINRQLNNLLKLRALEIAQEYKTKRFVIEGKNFNAHYKKL